MGDANLYQNEQCSPSPVWFFFIWRPKPFPMSAVGLWVCWNHWRMSNLKLNLFLWLLWLILRDIGTINFHLYKSFRMKYLKVSNHEMLFMVRLSHCWSSEGVTMIETLHVLCYSGQVNEQPREQGQSHRESMCCHCLSETDNSYKWNINLQYEIW